ncbi:MAG TPA: cytochrome c [Terriglobales bacterium]|nr:cytochrome c [Terriglobales bacterium]
MNWKYAGILVAVVAAACAGIWLYQANSAATRGEKAFQQLGCGGCHFSGAGPNLTHVVRTQDEQLLEHFIASPPSIYQERGMKSLNEGYMLMPDMHATPQQARDIVAYLRELNREAK